MNFLLKLPESLTQALLVNWLQLSIVAKLDTAYCNHQSRAVFCAVAFSSSTVYMHTPFDAAVACPIVYNCLEWLLLRKVQVQDVAICINVRHDWHIWVKYLAITGGHLNTVRFIADESFSVELPDELLSCVTNYCDANLGTLSIHNCSINTYRNFKRLLAKCTAITSINISLGQHLHNSKTYYMIAEHCPQLRTLDLAQSNIAGFAFVTLLQHCTQLTTLRLISCERIDTTSLQQIAQYCPHLQILHVKHRALTDATVSLIAQHCLDLTDITLISEAYTDTSMQTVARSCSKIRKLRFALNTNITDAALLAIGTQCTSLVELRVHSTYGAHERTLTEAGWASIFKNCTKLTNIVRPVVW